MVADVTEEERAAEDRKDALLPSSRLQIGFGVQVRAGVEATTCCGCRGRAG